MNKLSDEKRAQLLPALIEGNSIAATCRMTGAAKMTVMSLIREVGAACLRFHDTQVRHLSTVERVQCDEVWSYAKAKRGICWISCSTMRSDRRGSEGGRDGDGIAVTTSGSN